METNIDLKKIINTYPDAENDANKMRALVQDLYPTEVLEQNLAIAVMRAGIASQIRLSCSINPNDFIRYAKMLENNFGIAKKYANIALKLWANAYDIACPQFTDLDITQDYLLDQTVKSEIIGFNEVAWENEELRVVHKGFTPHHRGEAIDMFWCNVSVTNKTDKFLYARMINMRINDEVIKDQANMEVQPNARNEIKKDCWGMDKDLAIIGVKNESDIKKISYEIIYSYEKYYGIGKEVVHSPEIFIEPYYI